MDGSGSKDLDHGRIRPREKADGKLIDASVGLGSAMFNSPCNMMITVPDGVASRAIRSHVES